MEEPGGANPWEAVVLGQVRADENLKRRQCPEPGDKGRFRGHMGIWAQDETQAQDGLVPFRREGRR